MRVRAVIAALIGLAVGCGAVEDAAGDGWAWPDGAGEWAGEASGDALTPEVFDPACAQAERLRVVVLDAWGRRLPAWTMESAGALPAEALASRDWEGSPPVGGTLTLVAGAPDHASATARVTVPAPGVAPDVQILTDPGPAAGTWVALSARSRGTAEVPGIGRCPRHTVFIGLDHLWFAASGRAPTAGNLATLHLSGETFWADVHASFAAGAQQVRGTTWWWQSDFELVRPAGEHLDWTPEQRQAAAVLPLLEASGARARILIARYAAGSAGGMAYLNTDIEIQAHGAEPEGPVEVILQGNPTPVPLQGSYKGVAPAPPFAARVAANPAFAGEQVLDLEALYGALDATVEAASYHQKGFVVDGRVAYIAGMNVKSSDWDTEEHAVFEPRRMKSLSTSEERHRVAAKLQLPDLGPRKDYALRLEGPAATDADDVLRARWQVGLDQGAMYAENATPFELLPRPAPFPGGVQAQVVATLPDPIPEQSIWETWRKAIAHASEFIYIEDQYFRMPILDQAIAAALTRNPALTLIVVTRPVTAADGGKKYTIEADRLYRATAPDRYLLLQLKVFDAVARYGDAQPGNEAEAFYFQNMDTHSKILIVDDQYLSVGSCNKNNRGLLYEGELNGSVWDAGWVRDARRRIYRNLVGPERAGQVTDDPAANFVLLRDLAAENAALEAYWQAEGPPMEPHEVAAAHQTQAPAGFVYPLEITPDYVLEVGPDAF